MKVKTFLIMALMAVPGLVAAQNSLTVAETTIPQNGGQLKFNFTFAEENVYTSYQFKIVTPDGAVYDTDADGDVACTLGACHTASHAATSHWNAATSTLGVGVASMSSALLKGTAGELISIPLLETEKAVGTTLTFSVEDINFIRQDGGTKDKLDDFEVIITVAAPVEHRTLLDENSTTAPEAATDVNVCVKRTIKANEWSTIVLPFAMTEAQVKAAFGDDVQIGDFTGYDTTEEGDELVGICVNFDAVTSMEANHPYIIKVGEAVAEFTADGVTIEPEDNPSVSFGYNTGKKPVVYHPKDFNGTYVTDFDFYNDATSYPLFLSGNKFWYATESTQHMKAFRAYFDFDDFLAEAEGAGARIAMVFGDNTGIRNVNRETAGDGHYYNLQGLPVEAPARGVYIRNGKAVIVKQ